MGAAESYVVYEEEGGDDVSTAPEDSVAEISESEKSQSETDSEFYDAVSEQSEKAAGKLSAQHCPMESSAVIINDWRFLDRPKKIDYLNKGCALFSFCCRVGTELKPEEKKLVDLMINLSRYEDEVEVNNVPTCNIYDDADASQYTIILTKVAYMLPGIKISDITPELVASTEYQSKCVPGDPYVWPDMPDDTTFRITKTIVPWIYNITIQLKASTLAPQKLGPLSQMDDYPIHHGILMERTKRNAAVVDATRKAKSLLCYSEVPGGVLVTHVTCVLNTFVPSFLTYYIDSLGSFGCREGAATARLTRQYLLSLKAKK
eukprot:comp8100_c0_seq1/m.3583 comp8100_c0_seq1/g.3583  ORF comp8100_c0_seq1/g.3583 comp8100_c0_seq1/m.3583 type:complete len:318 (-) comp8100_c0_seq1:251-1204(-)